MLAIEILGMLALIALIAGLGAAGEWLWRTLKRLTNRERSDQKQPSSPWV